MERFSGPRPSLSIVTPCYNGEQYIREAIVSVRQQAYDDVEHIVVDGDSTDDTPAILDDYPDLTVISEPDDGIYDALNKGLSRASGEYIGWLNADDVYSCSAFDSLLDAYQADSEPDLIAGSCAVFEEMGDRSRIRSRHEFTSPNRFRRGYIDHRGALLNGCLLSSALLDRIGEFDAELDISADLDYLIRIAGSTPDIVRTNDVVYRYRHHDGSITFNDAERFDTTRETALVEGRQFMRTHMQNRAFPEPLREYCKREYRARSAALLSGYLAQRRVGAAVGAAVQTLRTDPSWLGWLLATTVRRSVSLS